MSFFRKNTPRDERLGKSIHKRNQSGNVFAMLFGAVAMVGVIGASTMTVMRGPVKSMSQVTKRTIAENNMMVTAKLAVISVANLPSGDCDSDGTTEAPGYSGGTIATTNGGSIPNTVGVSKQDPWGQEFVYCAWDHGSDNDQTCGAATGYLQGDSAASPSEYAVAIISAGPDGNYQTTCNDYTGPNSLITKTSGADDLIFGYTFQEAAIVAGGLWVEGAGGEAEIQRDLVVKDGGGTDQFAFDTALQTLTIGDGASGTGKFPVVNSGLITGYGGTPGVDSVDIALAAGYISGDGDNEGISIDATGNVTMSGSGTANSLSSTTTLGVGTNATIGGTLGVTGASTLGALSAGASTLDSLGVTNNATVGGTLGVTGNTTLGGTLGVTGASTLGTLSAGASTLDSLGVTNNATVGGTLGVTGATTLGTLSAGATSFSGNLAMGSNAITGLANPSANDDAATKNYVDTTIASVTGTNETDPQVGDVTTAGNYCIADGDSIECTVVTPPGDNLGDHTATTDIDADSNKIINLANPTLATDAANKSYVDGAVTAAAGTDDKIMDADNDTQIQVEEGADDDIIRFDSAGVERMTIDPDGNFYLKGIDNASSSVLLQNYGTSGVGFESPLFTMERANGTAAVPTAVLNGERIGALNWRGYDGTTYDASVGEIAVYAEEDFTSTTNRATNMRFHTRSTGATGRVERMRIDSNGNIGVGTAAPDASSLMDLTATDRGFLPPRVSDPATAIAAPATGLVAYDTATDQLQMYDGTSWVALNSTSSTTALELVDTDNDTKIQVEESADEDIIRFDTAGTERMMINASGQVGIGTNSIGANSILHIADNGLYASQIIQNTDSSMGTASYLVLAHTGTDGIMNGAAVLRGYKEQSWTADPNTRDGFLTLETREDNNMQERVRIDSNGNVGINTTSPDASSLLDLTATDRGFLPPRVSDPNANIAAPATGLIAYDSTDDELQLYDGTSWVTLNSTTTTTARELADIDNDTKIQVEESADEDIIRFDTAGMERMNINASGNVGIGSTAASKFLVTHDSTVIGQASTTAIFDSADNTNTTFALKARASTGIGSVSDLFVVRGDGNVGIGINSPTTALTLATETAGKTEVRLENATGGLTNIGIYANNSGLNFENYNGSRNFLFKSGSVGINTTSPDASSLLDLTATDRGFLPPRVSDPNANIAAPATGLIAYDSTDDELQVYDGTSWVPFSGNNAGDNLGNHIATQILNMGTYNISNAGQINGTGAVFNANTASGDVTITGQHNGGNHAATLRLNDGSAGDKIWLFANGSAPGNNDYNIYYNDGSWRNRFTIETSGDVGIGTSTPNAVLHMYSSTSGSNINLEGQDSNSTGVNFFTVNASGTTGITDAATKGWRLVAKGNTHAVTNDQNDLELAFYDGVTRYDYMFVEHDTGNVGIGTSAPSSTLHVQSPDWPVIKSERTFTTDGNTSRTALELVRSYDGGAGADGIGVDLDLSIETETEGTNEYVGLLRAVATDATAGTVDSDIYLQPYMDGATVNDAFVIKSTGQVGIGTTSPSDGSGGGGQALKLDVEGALGATHICDENGLNCSTPAAIAGATGGTIDEISDADNDTRIQVEESADEDIIRFDTAGNERMTISATGDVDMYGSDGAPAWLRLNNFGSGATDSSPIFILQRTNGTKAVPTAISSGNRLGTLAWKGYDGTGYDTTTAEIAAWAEENFTGGTNRATSLRFYTRDTGDTDKVERMVINAAGDVIIGSSVSKGDASTSSGRLETRSDTPPIFTRDYTIDGNTSRNTLNLHRGYSGGPGADGIGAHIDLYAETETEGDFDPIAQFQAVTTDATQGTVDSDIYLQPYLDGTLVNDAFVIKSSGNIGMGTATPDVKLTISSNTSTLPALTGNPAADTIMRLVNADSTSTRLLLDSFGATNSTTYRSANGTAAAPTATLLNDPLGGQTYFGYGATDFSSASRGYIISYAAENWTDAAQGTYFGIGTTAAGTTAQTEKIRITDTGDVGIGTSTPAAKLDVDGTVEIGFVDSPNAWGSLNINHDADSGGLVSFQDDGGDKFVGFSAFQGAGNTKRLFIGGTGWGVHDANEIRIYTDPNVPTTGIEGGIERFRITKDGNVGIGDWEAGGGDSIDSILHIQSGDIRLDGGAGNQAGCIRFDDASDKMQFSHDCTSFSDMGTGGGGGGDEIADADADTKIQVEETADEDIIRFDTAGSERMIIESDGRVSIGGAPFTTTQLTSQIYGTPENWKNGLTGYAFTSGASASYNGTVGVSGYAETAATGAGTTEAVGIFGKADGTSDANTQYVFGVMGQTETFDTDIGYALAARDNNASTGGTVYGLHINLDDTDITRYGIYQQSANDNYFAGNVGIGVSSPARILDVQDSLASRFDRADVVRGDDIRTVLDIRRSYDGGPGADGIGGRLTFDIETETEGVIETLGFLAFTATDATAGTVDSDIYLQPYRDGAVVSDAFIIKSTGNVGIGTSTPEGALDVISPDYHVGRFERAFAADGTTSRTPLTIARSYSGGAGADGIGVHLDFEVETETEGTIQTAASIQATATDATAGTIDSDIYLKPYLDGSEVSDAFVVKSTGNIGIGTATPVGILDIFIDDPVANADDNVFQTSYSDTFNPAYVMRRARGTFATPTTLQNNDVIGQFVARGHNGADFGSAVAGIRALAANDLNISRDMKLDFTVVDSDVQSTALTILNNGHVGIGTAAPENEVHIAGTGNQIVDIESTDNNAAQLRLRTNSTNRRLVARNASDIAESQIIMGDDGDFSFAGETVTGNTLMRLSSAGNLGVGDFYTDTIDSSLHIASGDIRLDGGAGNQAGCIRFNDTTDKMQFSHDCTSFSDMGTGGGGGGDEIADADNDTKIQVEEGADDDIIRFDTTGVERMVIASDGFVGIGTNTPTTILDVYRDYATDNNSSRNVGSFARMYDGGPGVTGIGAHIALATETTIEGNTATIGRVRAITTDATNGSVDADIYLDPVLNSSIDTDAFVVKSDGKVGIGTDTPAEQLEVTGATSQPIIIGAIAEDSYSIVQSRVYSDTQNANFIAYKSRGTRAVPTFPLQNDTIGTFQARAGEITGIVSGAGMIINAAENQSATNMGSSLSLRTVPNGTKTSVNRLTITEDGDVGIGDTTPDARLDVETTSGFAIWGTTSGAGNTAVNGTASAATGFGIGVSGSSDSIDGTGVFGMVGVGGGDSRGVHGSSASGSGYGGYFENTGDGGIGLYGYASYNVSGNSRGVYGQSASPTGRGVHAWASDTTDVNYGLYAATSSATGYGAFISNLTGSGISLQIGDGDVDMTSEKIVNLADPTAAQDAATKAYVDANGDNLGNHTATTNINIGGNTLDYNNSTGDKVLWYSNTYGTGIESNTLTNWSGNTHRWRIGGTSVSTGTSEMELTSSALDLMSNDITNGGDITADKVSTGSGINGGFQWENGVNSINNNDGAGNVQIRLGHDFSDPGGGGDERFTHGGGAAVITSNIDATTNTQLTFKVSSNPGAGDDAAVTWGSAMVLYDTELDMNTLDIVDVANIGIGQVPAAGVELDVLGDIEYTGTLTDVSDLRLKDNVVSLHEKGSMLDLIARVNPVSFTMKDDEDGKTEYGVIAQELETIFPDLVRTADDDIKTKSVNYIGLIAPMIEAVKELKAENDTLRAQNEEILNRLDALENK